MTCHSSLKRTVYDPCYKGQMSLYQKSMDGLEGRVVGNHASYQRKPEGFLDCFVLTWFLKLNQSRVSMISNHQRNVRPQTMDSSLGLLRIISNGCSVKTLYPPGEHHYYRDVHPLKITWSIGMIPYRPIPKKRCHRLPTCHTISHPWLPKLLLAETDRRMRGTAVAWYVWNTKKRLTKGLHQKTRV